MAGGKSLFARTLSGVLFFVVMVLCTLHVIPFVAVLCFIVCEMMHEYWRMSLGRREYLPERVVICAGAVSSLVCEAHVLMGLLDAKWLLLCALVPVFVGIVMLFRYRTADSETLPQLIYPLVYIVLPFALSQMLVFAPDGTFIGWLFLSLFIVIWCNDIGAYVLGMALGQRPGARKLFPQISPKKSWWGIVGGVIFSVLGALLMFKLQVVPLALPHYLAIAAIVVVFGTLGDLAESQVKRLHRMKDSGSIMPGHGGLLDRFDGALFVLPAVVIYLKLFSLI